MDIKCIYIGSNFLNVLFTESCKETNQLNRETKRDERDEREKPRHIEHMKGKTKK